jgi:hypothetical protein
MAKPPSGSGSPRKRAPRTGTKNQPLAVPETLTTPIEASSPENAEKLKAALAASQQGDVLVPKTRESETEFRASRPVTDYVKSDLERQLSFENSIKEDVPVNPVKAQRSRDRASVTRAFGPTSVARSTAINYNYPQIASRISVEQVPQDATIRGMDDSVTPDPDAGKIFVKRGEPVFSETPTSVSPGQPVTSPLFTSRQEANRRQLNKQQRLAQQASYGPEYMDSLKEAYKFHFPGSKLPMDEHGLFDHNFAHTAIDSKIKADEQKVQEEKEKNAPRRVEPKVSSGIDLTVSPSPSIPNQMMWRDVFRPLEGVKTAMPHSHKVELKSDGSAVVTPVSTSPGLPAPVEMPQNATTIPANKPITAEHYEDTGKEHVVNGQRVFAYNKIITPYSRTNNNGVGGLLRGAPQVAPGTFYRHPDTGEIVQTFEQPQEQKQSAVEMHHAALFVKYAPSSSYGNKEDRYRQTGSTSRNWTRDALQKAIKSVRNGDVAGTMRDLEQNPDYIHDLFKEHFQVLPAKRAAYREYLAKQKEDETSVPEKLPEINQADLEAQKREIKNAAQIASSFGRFASPDSGTLSGLGNAARAQRAKNRSERLKGF